VNKKSSPAYEILQGECAGEPVCPLSRVQVGARVCVKHLTSRPDVCDRLRELGLVEDQEVRLVSRQHNVICQVCNARVALSNELAEAILVQPVAPNRPARRGAPRAPQMPRNSPDGADEVTRPADASVTSGQ
jgi:Fe2+ transport system protein FeoA